MPPHLTGNTVTVYVDDQYGDPIEGVRVTVDGAEIEDGPATASTDANGEAVFTLRDGTYTFAVDDADYTYAEDTRTISSDETVPFTVSELHDLLSRVTDAETGDPASGIDVEADGKTDSTNNNGEATLELVDGTYTVEYRGSGYETTTETVTIDGADVAIDVVIEPTHTLTVFVDDTDNNPIEGAEVDVDGEGSSPTNTQGVATFELTNGSYSVQATADGYDGQRSSVTIDGADTSLEFTLAAGDFTLTVTVEDASSVPIEFARVTVDGDERGVDTSGTVEYDLPTGEYLVSAEAGGYRNQDRTVDVSGDATETFVLQEHPDEWRELSGSDGRSNFGEFAIDTAFSYSVDATGYDRLEDAFVFETTDERDIYLEDVDEGETEKPRGPIGLEPRAGPPLDIPDDIDPFFEISPLLGRGDRNGSVPVLVCNAGGQTGETRITLEGPDGITVDTRYVALRPGAYRVVSLSAVVLLRTTSSPTRATVRTDDDSFGFDLYAGPGPNTVLGPGRPTVTGGGPQRGELGTVGGDRERRSKLSTTGAWREPTPTVDPDLIDVPNGWGITLQNASGDRRHIESAAPDFSPEKNDISEWSVDVETDRSLNAWDFGTRIYLTFDGDLRYTGWCDTVEHSRDSTTLSGPGPADELATGSYEREIHGKAEWRAIKELAEDLAPKWEWTVVRPAPEDQTVLWDEDVSGTAWECINQVAKDYGMVTVIDPRSTRRALSFPPGGVVGNLDIEIYGTDPAETKSTEGYHNIVEVSGAEIEGSDGERYEATYPDTGEIERHARQYGIRRRDARRVFDLEDDSIESHRQARQRAIAKCRELVSNKQLEGSFDTTPQFARPGISYALPWDDDAIDGPHSYEFGPNKAIELPRKTLTRMQSSGAIVLTVRSEWSDLLSDEQRLFGVWPDWSDMTVDDGLEFRVGDVGSIRPYPDRDPDEPAPDNEILELIFGWEYDPESNETTLYAGDAEGKLNSETFDLKFTPPANSGTEFWIGRYRNDYFVGTIGSVELHSEVPDPTGPNPRPADTLVARYGFNEGYDVSRGSTVYDSVHGFHGTHDGVETLGTPSTLEGLDYGDPTTWSFESGIDLPETVGHLLHVLGKRRQSG